MSAQNVSDSSGSGLFGERLLLDSRKRVRQSITAVAYPTECRPIRGSAGNSCLTIESSAGLFAAFRRSRGWDIVRLVVSKLVKLLVIAFEPIQVLGVPVIFFG